MDSTILDWLDRAAVGFGDRTAYEDEQHRLNFQETDRISRTVGAYLQLCGLKPKNPVVVMGARYVYTPACYLGIVRAGCFYAPIDAGMPDERLCRILEVINARHMIVSRVFLEKARNLGFEGEIYVLEDILETGKPDDYDPCKCGVITEDTPLYVIFTSGSGGRPKGVITPHYAVMCYIDGVQSVLNLTREDVLGNQAPLDYIAAIRDIYLPLYTGASSFIIPKNVFAMPEKLIHILNERKVTVICWSTAGLEIAANLGAFSCGKPEFLRQVIFSGAVISNKALRIWQDHLPEVRFINQYGPTETTASCTWYEIEEKVSEDTRISIGQPYPHYSILLLNRDRQKPDEGEIGEICVGGPALALGYYGDPERTAASFIQNPLNNDYRELIYRTGDYGRYREDGLLEYCGRMDRQIKHFGHRIELDEIEVAAYKAEGVEDCCALYDTKKSLLYLFYKGTAETKEIAVRFRATMPAFMVPHRFKKLERIPKLPNGKTDMCLLQQQYFKHEKTSKQSD